MKLHLLALLALGLAAPAQAQYLTFDQQQEVQSQIELHQMDQDTQTFLDNRHEREMARIHRDGCREVGMGCEQ